MLVSSENPSNVGDQVTFTATVAASVGTGTPTGNVTFSIDGTPETPVALQVVGGKDQALFPTRRCPVGHAHDQRDLRRHPTFATSTVQSPLSQVVNASGHTDDDFGFVGEPVECWRSGDVHGDGGAERRDGHADGNVTFSIDGTPETPVALQVVGGEDQASFPISTLSVGQHTISVTYNGDPTFATSTVQSPLLQIVNLPGTQTTLVSSENPSSVGDQVTFTAMVVASGGSGTPTGNVTFSIDGTPETPVALQVVGGNDQASFAISTLSAGPHRISATYNGAPSFASSTVASPLDQVVNLLGTQTTLVSSENPSNLSDLVTFTATVGSSGGTGTPAGNVTFTIDGTPEEPVALQVVGGNNQASFSISTLSPGQHSISASYNGDATFAASTVASPISQVVVGHGTTTTVTASENPSNAGDQVTFTATVVASGGTGIPTGDVTFTIDGTTEPPVALQVVGGIDLATFSTSTLSAGMHSVTATYGGGGEFTPSTVTAPVSQTVAGKPAGAAPTVTIVQRFGIHMEPTVLVVTYSAALDPTTAQDMRNYVIVGPSGERVAIASAVYDAATDTVTLRPRVKINLHHNYQFTILGTGEHGVAGADHMLLNGALDGKAGSNYVTTLNWKSVVLTPAQAQKVRAESHAAPAGALAHRFVSGKR